MYKMDQILSSSSVAWLLVYVSKMAHENYTYTLPKSTNYLYIISKAISPLTIEKCGVGGDKSTKSFTTF